MAYDGEGAATIAAERLRSFVERVERVEEEITALQDDKKEIYAEAKGEGYDVKILKKVIARRRKDRSDLHEEETLLDLYEAALNGYQSKNDDFLD